MTTRKTANNSETMKFIYEVLGLSNEEVSILEQTARFAKTTSVLARHTGVLPHSLPYILRMLEKRHLISRSGHGHKQVRWRSNMTRILQAFRNECLKQRRSTTKKVSNANLYLDN
jgi:DNA-binding MarR family transcriptional regulator